MDVIGVLSLLAGLPVAIVLTAVAGLWWTFLIVLGVGVVAMVLGVAFMAAPTEVALPEARTTTSRPTRAPAENVLSSGRSSRPAPRSRPYHRVVTEYQPSDIRVSDSEREDALGKLGEHMSAGRLDIDEYGERTAKVTTAKTRGEVLDLFGDLPEPRPAFGRPAPPPAAPAARTPSLGRRVAPVVVPVVAIVLALGLLFVVEAAVLLPAAVRLLRDLRLPRRRGFDQHRSDEYRRAMREHRDAIREQHRRMRRQWRDDGMRRY